MPTIVGRRAEGYVGGIHALKRRRPETGGWARTEGRGLGTKGRGWRWWARAEFPRVNTVAGSEPVLPELSGLRVRYPAGGPRRMKRLLVQLAYRWQPSREYERRQTEMRKTNRWLRFRRGEARTLPPILSYPEDTEVSATRLQPMPNQDKHAGQLAPVDDMSDIAEAVRLRDGRVLHPHLTAPEAEYLLAYRPLLPRQYRQFLRYSPYPRIVVMLVAGAVVLLSVLWVNQVRQAEALAASRLHLARHTFRATIDQAHLYGVDPRNLRPLEIRARALDRRSVPSGLPVMRTRVRFYRAQERAYTALLHVVRRLERRALSYWRWREGVARASLMAATWEANRLGLPAALSPAPACRTPRCYRRVMWAHDARAAWLRETGRTLRVYGAAVAASQDPAGTASAELQKARALQALLRRWAVPPARLAELGRMDASATGPADYARVGALAHLDGDALLADLVRTLPGRVVVVSTEDELLTCYDHRKAVYHSPVATDSSTPNGIFHIQAREAEISTVYWSGALHYDGSLPDRMPFSGGVALQGAPWRSVFGPGSDGAPPAYAPSTPGSIDLPLAAADHVFGWTSVGTEVVIY